MAKPVYRRITAAEDPAAHKARIRTTAAPGKLRKNSKRITQRQYQERVLHKGVKIEVLTKQREAASPAIRAKNAQRRESLIRNKFIRETFNSNDVFRPRSGAQEDIDLVAKFNKVGFKGLSERDKKNFGRLFIDYPDDTVRSWLGSSEQSRALRNSWASSRAA